MVPRGKVADFLLMTVLLLFISFSMSMFPRSCVHAAVAEPEHYVDVPFYYQENDYYCGPAAVQMVFDFYGENVSQSEIADVARTVPHVTFTDEMRRAVHFSNLSTSMGTEMTGNITGYTLRKLGYAAFETGGMTLDDLKALIDRKFPMILLMRWIHGEQYGHYRVAVGYNDTHIFLHDPWNTAWGYTAFGGPNIAMNYTFFLDMWDYAGYWGLFVSPWQVTINPLGKIHVGEGFEVTANIFYASPGPISINQYPASSCNASIILSEGLTLPYGEGMTRSIENLQAGSITQTSWALKATQVGNHSITVQVEGVISGFVTEKPEAGPSYEYQDKIGGSASILVTAEIASQIYIRGIDPNQEVSEAKVRLFGGGATPNGTVEALFGGPVNQTLIVGNDSFPIVIIGEGNLSVGWTAADPDGFWELGFNVPQVPIGNYSVYAVDNETSSSDVIGFGVLSTQVQIRIVYVSVSSALPNTTVNLNGDGATPYNDVRIYFDGINVANITVFQGFWSTSFSVPDVRPGNYAITALDVATNTRDTALFTVTPPPTIYVSPQEAAIGSEITVTGEGFPPNTGIYLTFEDMLFFTPIYIGERGEFNATIFVPTIASGNYTIKAVGTYFYQQGLQALVGTNFRVTTGLDTLFQTIDDLKTALNQTESMAQTTLDEAISAKEAAQAAEAVASQARAFALIAMILTIITSALVSIYFITLYKQIETPKQKEETT